MRPTRAIVSLSRLRNNISELRSLISHKTAFMAVVKANAYGHGLTDTAICAVNSGAQWLGVALPEEGALLREKGLDVPILVLGEIDRDQCGAVIDYDLIQSIPSLNTARILDESAKEKGRRVRIHIKLDTGMGRIGFRTTEDLQHLLEFLKNTDNLIVDGAFTHFAVSDEKDTSYTYMQIDRFNELLAFIRRYGFQPNTVHACNSAGVLRYKEAHYDLVRCGISMYGYYPSNEMEYHKPKLLPALQWETKIAHIKYIESGDSVSYGRKYTAQKRVKVATLPVGYADGYNRLLSNNAEVLVRGYRAPVIGRICMDQMMVDVSDIPGVELGDQVVLIGEQGNESIYADELAEKCNTISYEILTSISDRVPRIYVE